MVVLMLTRVVVRELNEGVEECEVVVDDVDEEEEMAEETRTRDQQPDSRCCFGTIERR